MEHQLEHDLIAPPEISRIADSLECGQPQDVLGWAIDRFGSKLGLCSSFQVEGCALIDMTWRLNPAIRVFTIDTGRMPQETYELIDRVRERYGIKVEVFLPDTAVVEQMITAHGNNLFYKDVDSRLLCCQVRKVQPLRRALTRFDAWVTGLRRDQVATRSNTRKVSIDQDHGGIVKLAPLADWTEAQVWDYVRGHDVPVNELYSRGYTSIGCAPCTRPVSEGEDPRAGRWWWETGAVKECGMHCSLESGSMERNLAALKRAKNGSHGSH